MKNIGVLFLTILLIGLIDQTFFYYDGHWRSHALYCSIKSCDNHPFTLNKEVGFLINPDKKLFFKDLARTKNIEPHDDYQLNNYGLRISKEWDDSKKKSVNVYGDSFTFGLFLKESETFVDILNRESKSCHFRNYGVPAFDLWQMIKLRHSRNIPLHAEFHLFLFITDDVMRITRPFEVHPIGRSTLTYDLIEFSKFKGKQPPIKLPLVLVRNSYFFQKLYRVLDRRWWDSIDSGALVEFFKSREYDNTRFIHIPSLNDYHPQEDGEYGFYPLKGLERFSTEKFKNLKNFEKYFFKGDGHPNQLGAQMIANEVLKQMQDICPQ
jgi:hypothetical protein